MGTTKLGRWMFGFVALIGAVRLIGIFVVAVRPAESALPVAVVEAQESGVHNVTVTAHKYAFAPARIEVDQNDIVKVTLKSDDIAHSFTIDEPYRIAKRVVPGQEVVFEFRADQAGTFPFYCNLTIDDGCKGMKGTLVVRPRK